MTGDPRYRWLLQQLQAMVAEVDAYQRPLDPPCVTDGCVQPRAWRVMADNLERVSFDQELCVGCAQAALDRLWPPRRGNRQVSTIPLVLHPPKLEWKLA